MAGLDHDRRDEAGVEFEDEAEVRAFRRSLDDPSRDRQGGGGDQILGGIGYSEQTIHIGKYAASRAQLDQLASQPVIVEVVRR